MLYGNPMTKEQYDRYRNSSDWKAKRKARLEMDKYRCRRCGLDGDVVHHRTYENIGNEKMEDLETLCSWCHKRIHGLDKIVHNRKLYRAADKYERKVGFAYKRGGTLSIAEIWNITRMPPENEINYRCTDILCESLNAEMDGAGRVLGRLIRSADEEFEVSYNFAVGPKPRKNSKRYAEYEKEVDGIDKTLEFLESKKLIVRRERTIMVHPYLNMFERDEVFELCYYNKFCDLWEALHKEDAQE